MNIFRRIFGADFWRDIVSAFRIYPLSAIISLFATALLIADIMDFAPIALKWRFFALIAFCLALGVEAVLSSLRGARSATKQSKKIIDCHEFANANSRNDDTGIDCHENSLRSFAGFASESRNDDRVDCFGDESPRNDGVWQIAKCATFALIATPIYFYIARSVENIALPTHIAPPTFLLHYFALCVIFTLIFVALNLEKSFRSLYNATIRAVFLCAVCGLFGVLLFIFALLCDMLFSISIYRFALSVEICAIEATFLLFLATFKRDIEANLSIILRILNVFATLYVAVFLLYFIGVFALDVKLRTSIVHLVVWYSFFALFLWWLNMAQWGKSLGESSDLKRESTPKINKIFMRFAPLGVLFVLNIIAFYAIILRIAQYGVTIERYFVVVGCVALLVNLAFSAFCKRPIAKGIVAIIILVAFSAFGWKFNAIDLSLNSQYKELEKARNSGDTQRVENIKRFIAYWEGRVGESTPNGTHSEEVKFFTFDDFSVSLDSKAILRIKYSTGDILSRTSGDYRYEITNDKIVKVYQIAPKSLACEFDLKAIARNLDKNIIKISGATIIIQNLSANFGYDSYQKPISVEILDFDIIVLLQ